MYFLSLNVEQHCCTGTHSVAVYVIESVVFPNVLCDIAHTLLSVYLTGNDDFQKLGLTSLSVYCKPDWLCQEV
jgi:hypothetical protein